MIIGGGLVANALQPIDSNELLFFASGVSDSLEISEGAFLRESELLKQAIDDSSNELVVYFSTCSIYDRSVNDRKYVRHKLRMEEYIQMNASKFLIFRVSNLVGKGGNPNTIMNYLVHSVKNDIAFDVWENACRNLLAIDDLVYIVHQLLLKNTYNTIYNIAFYRSFSVLSIVQEIERYYKKKANYNLLEGLGLPVSIDVYMIAEYLHFLDSDRSGISYIQYLLNKYYT